MGNYLTLLSDVLVLLFDFTLYFLIIPLKKDTKFYRGLIISGCFLMLVAFIVGVTVFDFVVSKWLVISVTIPSFILLFSLSKYKDMRFVLTFCFIDTVALMIGYLSKYAALVLGLANTWIPFVLTFVFLSCAIFFGRKYIRAYKDLIEKVGSSWTELAIASIFIYIYFVSLMAFPKPFKERTEYGPIILLFCITIVVFYYVFISSIIKTKKIEEANCELKEKNKLYELAYNDSLCDIGNRASFDKLLRKIDNSSDIHQNICFIFMDIDNMKLLNDTKGHYAGDRVLIFTADTIKKVFSSNDSEAFRVGGDEFCVLCFNKTQNDIEKLLNTLNNEVRLYKPYEELTISSGYEFWEKDSGYSLSGAFIKADKKMYENKRKFKESV